MNKVERLIEKLCPKGVEWKTLGEVCRIQTGKLNANAMKADGAYPFFTCSDTISKIDTWAFDCEALLVAGNGNIGETKHYKGKFNAYQRTYVLNSFLDEVLVKFLYHVLCHRLKPYVKQFSKDGTLPYITLPVLSKFSIPVPPLEVQSEIVQILDNFAKLTAELTAELAKRKKQYEHYRDTLLSGDWPRVKLGEVAEIGTGSKPAEIGETGVFDYINAGTEISGKCNKTNTDGDTVTTPSRGQGGIGFVGYQSRKFWCGPLCYRIRAKIEDVIAKFIYYYLSANTSEILALKKTGGIPALNLSDLKSLSIPLPPLAEQERIVGILDKFDKLVNSLTEGLPAEIAAREKQYAYYRDKLLSFGKSI